MATKSFLTPPELKEAQSQLSPPSRKPDGDERKRTDFRNQNFSNWLGERLLTRLSAHPSWEASEPIAVGSWARKELCPKSDIDLVFAGDPEQVRALVSHFAGEGLKLRSRVPADTGDWTQGVQPFDILALRSAVALTPSAAVKLQSEVARLNARWSQFRRPFLRAMVNERRERNRRYDSISNFLEPNLKYGPGGLRDLEQALMIRQLFPERFEKESDHAFEVLKYYKHFLLLVRQKLHLSDGGGETLAAPEQRPIAEWLGFDDPRDFMREIQKGVSRVSFYADWVIEQASSPLRRIEDVRKRNLSSVPALLKAFEDDSSVLMQNQIRLAADRVFKTKSDPKKIDRLIGQSLTRALDPAAPEDTMNAVFRSRLIDHCVPQFRKIVGYVQHDQYHRFSVDAHLLQVLRELKRLRQKPSTAGGLSRRLKQLDQADWMILAFAALYHDIAKGRGGDHAVKGVAIAEKDLRRFGKSPSFIREVCWLVEEHLLLSAAAFRENPRSPRTWRQLKEKSAEGRRLYRLAAFTVADIRATNPEAWTPWKERLLSQLVDQVEKPESQALVGLAKDLNSAGLKGWERILETLDPFLVASVPKTHLLRDIKSVADGETSQPPRVVPLRTGNGTWIRFHSAQDRPGLFLEFVQRLHKSGLGVRHASILTDPDLGAYDWFEVKSTKTAAQIQKRLEAAERSSDRSVPIVAFDTVEIVTEDKDEWVVSFRGRDQAGALMAAAQALYECGVGIHWAKVHTWGRQIDDVFGITPASGETEAFLLRLKNQLGKTPAF